MVLKYYISAATAITEDLTVKIYEAQAPEAVIYTQTLAAPHAAPVAITVNGLDRVVLIVRLYGATSGALYHEYNVEPAAETATVFDPIWFKIGDGSAGTPAANSNAYTNAVLVGLAAADFTVHRNNYGYLKEGVHFAFNPTTGTVTLMGQDWFNEGEEFLVQRKTKVSTQAVNDSVVGKWFAGVVDVTANLSYDPAHLRKLLRFSGTCTYTLAGAIPIGYAFCFQHYGTAGTGTVKFQNAPLRWSDGSAKSTVDIAPGQQGCFVFNGAQWDVVYLSGSATASNTAEPPAGTVLGAGEYSVGDVAAGDPQYTIFHGANTPWNYTVMLSIKTNNGAGYASNNKIGATWWIAGDRANQFYCSLQEISSEVQNVSIAYMLVKI